MTARKLAYYTIKKKEVEATNLIWCFPFFWGGYVLINFHIYRIHNDLLWIYLAMRQKIGSSKISAKFYILSLLIPTQIERNTTKFHHHLIEFTKTYLSKNVTLPHRLEGKKTLMKPALQEASFPCLAC